MESVNIDLVRVGRKRRELGEFDALADSIASIGLINPISVTEDLQLIAGLHRLEACKSLGWLEIPAIKLSLDDISIDLAEIDENLIRNELNVLERSEQLKRRKDLYEAMYPETKNGGDRKSEEIRTQNVRSDTPSFTKDTSAKTKQSVRKIQTDVQIASRIAEPVRDAIRNTPLADKKTELIALTQVDAETQAEIVGQINSGNAATVNQAINKLYPNSPKTEKDGNLKSHEWINKIVSLNDSFKLIRERENGIANLTRNWTLGNKQTLLAALEIIVKSYGELAAELGEIIENEK